METSLDDTFNHANVGIAHVAPDGRWLRVNDALCQLMHLSREQLLQTRFQALTHADDLNSDLVLLEQLTAGEINSYRIEKRYHRGDGRLIWVDLQVGAQRDSQGRLRYCISTMLDITARKQAEAGATEMRQRLTYALDAGGLGEWSLDIRTGEAERSRRHDEIFGYVDAPPDWNYNVFLRHVYPDDRRQVHDAFRQSMTTGTEWTFDVRILRRDGVLRWIWACGRVTLVEDGQPVRLSGVVQDITRRKRYEQANRLLAEIAAPLASLDDDPHRLQSVVSQATPDLADRCAIDLLQADGSIHRVADSICGAGPVPPASSPLVGADVIGQRLSLRMNQLGGDDLRRLAVDDTDFVRLRRFPDAGFLGVPIEHRGNILGALTLYVTDSGRRLTSSDVELAGRIAERIGEALENARLYRAIRQADERKDVFLAMLSHEIRNPLGAIRAGVELLRMDQGESRHQWASAMIDRQIQNLSRLMDDLMDVSRITRGTVTLSPRPVILQDILRDAVAAVHGQIESRKHRLETRLPDKDIHLVADATRLEQVVVNLLTNACKYTPPGGTIRLQAAEQDERIIIRVADDGTGIDPAQLHIVFALFTQLDRDQTAGTDGLGLGLTLVRELVELHGGQVHASSEGRGKGSEFTVLLPRVAPGAQAAASIDNEQPDDHPPSIDPATGKLHILLVDDHEDAVTALAEGLRLRGHSVDLAMTAGTALDCARRQAPDLVLLDIDLPDMSGIELAGLLHELPLPAHTELIALTGFGQASDRQRTAAAGFTDHLVKPLDFNVLAGLLARQAGRCRNRTAAG